MIIWPVELAAAVWDASETGAPIHRDDASTASSNASDDVSPSIELSVVALIDLSCLTKPSDVKYSI